MSVAFSPLQRQCLQAMGYVLYQAAPLAPALSLMRGSGPGPAAASSPLLRAIARAARHVDIAGLELDEDALRREVAAKRALWRRLRAMRRR